MAMPTPDDDMSLREIARTLADFRAEFRSQVSQLVRTDVYREAQAADRSRLTALEKATERDAEDQSANRRLILAAFVTAAASLIGSLLLIALTR